MYCLLRTLSRYGEQVTVNTVIWASSALKFIAVFFKVNFEVQEKVFEHLDSGADKQEGGSLLSV